MIVTAYSVKKKIATSAIILALVVLGLYGIYRLPVDFLPNVTYPMVKVHIWWRGATPEEIDKNIADPIERQMATVDNLDYLESSSIEGMYTLLVNFKYGVDVNVAYQDALAAMARANRELPKDIDPPVIIKADPSQLPVLQLTISSEELDLVKLRTWVVDWLQDQMLSVPGVAGTETVGGLKREIRVLLDPDALDKYKIVLSDITKRLQEENVEQFGGRITVGRKEIIARTMGEYKNLDEIRNILIAKKDNSAVYLKDIAEVIDSNEEARVITRFNGKTCVKLNVMKQADANTVEVAIAAQKKIEELAGAIPINIKINIVENQADYVKAALEGVRNTAVEAAILVVLIVWIFLGSWRQVLVIASALPVTLILNFGLMKLAGFSLNIFSLGGLVIAIGILVDNSIVVIENITRIKHLKTYKSLNDTIVSATEEVGPAVVAATFSFLALFLPFLIVPGLVSLLFKELILVIAGIVIISLFVAITFTPMMMSIVMSDKSESKTSAFERFFDKFSFGYESVLRQVLRWKYLVIVMFIAMFVVSVYSFKKLGSEFLPQMDDGRVMIKVKLPTGASVAETDNILKEIESKIKDDKYIESAFTLVGGKVWGLYTYEIANEGEIDIQLVPKKDRDISTKQYIDKLRPIISKVPVPGGKAIVAQMKIKGIRKLGDADIEVKIKGQDLDSLYETAKTVSQTMSKLKQFTNVYVSMDITKPEYQVHIDRKKAADFGVTVRNIADTMKSLITGTVASRYRDGNDYYNIRVLVPENKMISRQSIENLPLRTAQGGYIYIKDVAKVSLSTGPVEIVREDQIKEVIVRGDALGVSVGEALSSLKTAIANSDKPEDVTFYYGGQSQMMSEMIQTIVTIFGFAIFFSFVVLTVQFNSLKLPSIILLTVPFCLSGFIFLMQITKFPLGATVIIGILVIIAATVTNGVLLITFAHELEKDEGLSSEEAVLKAARIRLRPRLMTTIAVLIGFAPLALGIEEGGDMLQPMAVAAIGGLFMDAVVALFLTPCFYVLVSKEKNSKKEVFDK